MFLRLIFLLVALLPCIGSAQPNSQMVRSRSNQFVVYGTPTGTKQRAVNGVVEIGPAGQGQVFRLTPNVLTPETKTAVNLEPGLVAVSCERIKEALLRELQQTDSNQLRVHIQLDSRLRQHQTKIVADRYERGWMYTIELPTQVDEHFFSATILQVLLYEMANRNSPDQQIDLPKWLISGLISHLQGTTLQDLTLRPNADLIATTSRSMGSQQKGDYSRVVDPLFGVRQRFEKELPLSFEELSWPETLAKERAELFRDSAHLFVHQLLQLPKGKESLRNFISELQRHRNWQFAFTRAFNGDFKELVDVEKWWSVNFVSFMGRDASRLWTAEESWQQLKAALDVTMQVHFETNRVPVTAEYNLQEAISKWEPTRQDLVLQKSLQKLRVLRFRTHPELRTLVDSYRKVIEKYIEQRSRLSQSTIKNQNPVSATILKKNTCRELDSLDEERTRLRQKWLAASAAASASAK